MSHYRGALPHRQSPIHRTGRKSTKCGPSGAVWPPELEEALLEGLATYRPPSGRDPLLLKRFPKRNKIISDYILRKTRTFRTAKQVSSRLQQLGETCRDHEIIALIYGKSKSSRLPDQYAPLAYSDSREHDMPAFCYTEQVVDPSVIETPVLSSSKFAADLAGLSLDLLDPSIWSLDVLDPGLWQRFGSPNFVDPATFQHGHL